MQVELLEHYGINVATKQRVYLGQYRIVIDGRHVGYVRDEPGGSVSLVQKVSTREREEIELAVGGERTSNVAPDVPVDVMQPGGMEYDDFD